jgi:replicative DNA helicase
VGEEPAPRRASRAQTASEVLGTIDRRLRRGTEVDVRRVPTGFGILDEVLGGGLSVGDLLTLGGPPGVGKTIVALQWARNIAKSGSRAVFVCYEHDPATLLTRLLALEAGEADGNERLASAVGAALARGDAERRGLAEVLSEVDGGTEALERLQAYADDLVLIRGFGRHTTLSVLRELVEPHVSSSRKTVLFVDYLQKIPERREAPTETDRVTRTVEAVKDLALDLHVPVVLISAIDSEGMRVSRIRLHHLRGASAIAFESDVVLMINDKKKAVSKVHLTYDPVRARTFGDWAVFSIEKNRGGISQFDLEFEKDFAHFRFSPDGGIVSEQLVSERIDESEL